MNRRERSVRASRAAARKRQAAAPAETAPPAPQPFRVLVCVHRPRYRSRAERAVAFSGWEVRSLLNREDPIGLINRQAPDILVISVDAERSVHTGYLRAAQRYRAAGMRIVVLGETEDDAEQSAEECDASLSPPWKAVDLRAIAARMYEERRGEPPEQPAAAAGGDEE